MRKLFYSMLVAGALMFAATACERDADDLNPNPPTPENPNNPNDPNNPDDPTPGEPALRFLVPVEEGLCEHNVEDWTTVEWTEISTPDYPELVYNEDEGSWDGLLKVEWANCAAPVGVAEGEWLRLTAVDTTKAAAEAEVEWESAVYALSTEGVSAHGAEGGKVAFAYGDDKTATLSVAAGIAPHTLAAYSAEVDSWDDEPVFSNRVDGTLELVWDVWDDRYEQAFRLDGRNLDGVELTLTTDPEEAYWLTIQDAGTDENPYTMLFVDGASEVAKECTLTYTCAGGEELLSFKVVVPAVEVIKRSLNAYAAVLNEEDGKLDWAKDDNGDMLFETMPVANNEVLSMFWDGSKYCHYLKFETDNVDEVKVEYQPEWLSLTRVDDTAVVYLEVKDVNPYEGADESLVLTYGDKTNERLALGIHVEAFPTPVLTAYAAKGKDNGKGWEWERAELTSPDDYAYETTPLTSAVTLVSGKNGFEYHFKLVTENFLAGQKFELKNKYELEDLGIDVELKEAVQGSPNGMVSLGYYYLDVESSDKLDSSKANEFTLEFATDDEYKVEVLKLVVKTEAVKGVEEGYPKVTSFYTDQWFTSNKGDYYEISANIDFVKNSENVKADINNISVYLYLSDSKIDNNKALAAVKEQVENDDADYNAAVVMTFNNYGTQVFSWYYNQNPWDKPTYIVMVPVLKEGDAYYYGEVVSYSGMYNAAFEEGNYGNGLSGIDKFDSTMQFEAPNVGGGDVFAQSVTGGEILKWLNIETISSKYGILTAKITSTEKVDDVEKVYIVLDAHSSEFAGSEDDDKPIIQAIAEAAFKDYATTGEVSRGEVLYANECAPGEIKANYTFEDANKQCVYVVLVDKQGKLTLRTGGSFLAYGVASIDGYTPFDFLSSKKDKDK